MRRHPERAAYDAASLDAVLRAGWLAHVGFAQTPADPPVVLPMLYAWLDGALYLHGAVASRMLRTLAGGTPCCVTVTHVDGLVLARSHFSHSVNYRSAVVFGRASNVDEPVEKQRVLAAFVDAILPGRAVESRPGDANEVAATRLLRVSVEQASVKCRSGGVRDHAEDLGLPAWAGVVPLITHALPAQPEPELPPGMPLPASVQRLLNHP